MNRLLLFCLLLCKLSIAQTQREEPPLPAYFQEELKKTEEQDGSRFYQEFLNMLFSLALLIALLLAGLWFFKRMMHTRSKQLNVISAIKVLEQRQLSNKSHLYLVEVGDETHLIGESLNGLTAFGKVTLSD